MIKHSQLNKFDRNRPIFNRLYNTETFEHDPSTNRHRQTEEDPFQHTVLSYAEVQSEWIIKSPDAFEHSTKRALFHHCLSTSLSSRARKSHLIEFMLSVVQPNIVGCALRLCCAYANSTLSDLFACVLLLTVADVDFIGHTAMFVFTCVCVDACGTCVSLQTSKPYEHNAKQFDSLQ